MASPLTTIGAATIGPAVSVTSPGSAAVTSSQVQPQTQHETAALPTSSAQPKDNVELSFQALSLSKGLTDTPGATKGKDSQTPATDQAIKQKTAAPVITQPAGGADPSANKQYPPFMGNSNRLNELKLTAPALYRQVLRMIVPPPANLSYADMQYLKRSTADPYIR